MKLRTSLYLAAIFCLVVCYVSPQLWADETTPPQDDQTKDSGLAAHLTSKLGVTKEQAIGGAGAIFQVAQKKLSVEDFAKVSGAIPEMNTLLSAVPKTEDMTSVLGSTTLGNASNLATLAAPFQKLGMKPDMVGKFVPEVISFVQTKGGDAAKNALAGVLK